MSLRRRLLILAGLTLATAGVLYLVSLVDQQRSVGAIVVLGAAQYNGKPSPVLKARLRHALGLYQLGYAPLIVVTGGTASGDEVSEAEAGRRYLVSEGVADSAVLVVPEGTNTDETMDALADWVRAAGKGDVLLVRDGFQMARLRVEARRHGLRAWTTPATSSPISGPREWSYFLAEGIKFPVAYLRDEGAEWPDASDTAAP